MTRPTTAATIVFLAPSTAVLSPPDITHLIPPHIRKNRATTTAIIKRIVTAALIMLPNLPVVMAQSGVKALPLVGHKSIAKADAGKRR